MKSALYSPRLHEELIENEMAQFPHLEYSMKQVLRAGKALQGDMHWDESTKDQAIEIFRIAHSWRDSHALPMKSIRQEMLSRMRSLNLRGVTAARLKRMISIRKKLRRISAKLNQIQDLGGCRIILPSMEDTKTFIEEMRQKSKHDLSRETDYIALPKGDGYRSHHMVYKFKGNARQSEFDGRRIEIQIRTRLQHTWATAVETIGLVRGEDMKASQGDADWLRLFDLMSAEFALAENSPERNDLPEHTERVQEIEYLERKLDAVNILDGIRFAIHWTDRVYTNKTKPEYFKIAFNKETQQVDISEYTEPKKWIDEYNSDEEKQNLDSNNQDNTVIIGANRIEDLRVTYPNYFGDVQLFNKNLKDLCLGKTAQEYTLPPINSAPNIELEPADMSWFRPGRNRRWT
ncbi:RelA/SpoT domain-containing protein [uncultured Nisaea sp.]|uniref:RelA/SpoT domain-containing protein n=1 Tax=uncultured Nisaea sp. TaxID=538215 RepID=UPI0030EF5857|tara:strand:- start:292 stop:1503 length:1212 start_codon:yes stop_codon:yes gene_type:complete